MSAFKDLTNKRFGRLIVLHRAENNTHHTRWLCKCDCGNETISHTTSLTSGKTQSCGCKNKEVLVRSVTKHGGRKTKLYKHWCSMKRRCYDPQSDHYKRYGGRGIKVCEEWKNDFIPFRDWALSNGFDNGLTIDRKDNDGDYKPDNCRWVTQVEQVRNRSNTVFVDYNGRKCSLGELAEILGLRYKTLHAKYMRGEPIAVGVTYYDLYLKKVNTC